MTYSWLYLSPALSKLGLKPSEPDCNNNRENKHQNFG